MTEAFLIGGGEVHRIVGQRGETPSCPAAKFKRGDVVNVRRNKAVGHFPAELIVLVAIPVAAWIWIVVTANDMYGSMQGASGWMMSTEWDWPRVVLLWAMWAVMMTAMMLPSAAPCAAATAWSSVIDASERRSAPSSILPAFAASFSASFSSSHSASFCLSSDAAASFSFASSPAAS